MAWMVILDERAGNWCQLSIDDWLSRDTVSKSALAIRDAEESEKMISFRLSITEADYYASFEVVIKILNLSNLLHNMGFSQDNPMPI